MKKVSNWFSNFIPFDQPVIFNDILFYTPEHLYQALKAKKFEDVLKISSCNTPGQAKKMGRIIQIRSDWEDIKLEVMEYVLRKKFNKNTVSGQKLMLTDGNIVEYNYWHDNFWGDCLCFKCKFREGQNHLGKILMKIRKELKG